MESAINCVVLTTLHDNFLTTIKSVNRQSLVPKNKFLIVDSKFADRWTHYSENEVLYNWKIVILRLDDDFGDYRTRAIDFISKNEWLCFLDDDEWIHPEFFKNLDSFVTSVRGPLDAIRLPRSNSFGTDVNVRPELDWLNPDGLNFPDWQGRVLLNTGSTRYQGAVHETLAGFTCMVDLKAPYVVLLHHKTEQMQSERNRLWSRLTHVQANAVRSENDSTSFVDYFSQCKEDYFLSNLMSKFGEKVSKVVVEIGAGHPIDLSNSRRFILDGYRALLIEGNRQLFESLSDEYQDCDVVDLVNCVVTGDGRDVDFHVSKIHWALSGIGGVSQAERHSASDIQVETISTTRPSEIIKNWTFVEHQIGILSIDIEGLEDEIVDDILSNTSYRPTFIVIEALSDSERKKQELLLEDHNYTFVKNLKLSNVWITSEFERLNELVSFSRAFDPFNNKTD
jgi:FkbM family methyltransferase